MTHPQEQHYLISVNVPVCWCVCVAVDSYQIGINTLRGIVPLYLIFHSRYSKRRLKKIQLPPSV